MRLFFILVMLSLLPACSSRQSAENDGMDAVVVLHSIHRCSRISPEIDIVNYPPQTARFDVRLEDRTDPRKIHGGGSWQNDGTGIIPGGALMQHYLGPCPPSGTERSYQFVITAVDAQGQPLAGKNFIFVQE